MDEYLFITLAKLKADRLKLERERREALGLEHSRDDRSSGQARRSAGERGFSHQPRWRTQP